MAVPPESAVLEIIAVGRRLDARGLAAATSGNYSSRIGNDRIAITVSGSHKGRLGIADVIEAPATLHTESVANPVAVCWISFLEQISFDSGENAVLICLSVVSSVQCCIVISGIGPPVRIILISHRPALRVGSSTAAARPENIHSKSPVLRPDRTIQSRRLTPDA